MMLCRLSFAVCSIITQTITTTTDPTPCDLPADPENNNSWSSGPGLIGGSSHEIKISSTILQEKLATLPEPEDLKAASVGDVRDLPREEEPTTATATEATADPEEEEVSSQIELQSPDNEFVIKAPVCPFFLRISFSTFETIKSVICICLLIPIRFLPMLFTMLLGWCLAFIGTFGRSEEELQNEPLSGWRRLIRWFVVGIMRTFFIFGGFWWVSKRGKLATAAEAPILVAAPHSSYFDSLALITSGIPSVVARAETRNELFSGKLVNLLQPVYVSRESRESRANTVKAIGDRVQKILEPDSCWSQLFMYPEGTCGNRSCIMQFKIGAFIPGVPVQPVLLRYPNRMDYITWTFDGPHFFKSLVLTLSQFWNYCFVQYLPVYVPSEEEKKDPVLYANNVRAVMAQHLGIPLSDYTFEDGVAIEKFDKEKLSVKLRAVADFRNKLSVSPLLEISVMRNITTKAQTDNMVSRETLARNLLLNTQDVTKFRDMFEVLDQKHHLIDEREYLVYACLLNPMIRVEHLLGPFFMMYSHGRKRMASQDFSLFMSQAFYVSVEDSQKLFASNKPEAVGDLIDLDAFSKKVKHRLEYLKLLALEALGLIKDYPPRDHELRNSAGDDYIGYTKKSA